MTTDASQPEVLGSLNPEELYSLYMEKQVNFGRAAMALEKRRRSGGRIHVPAAEADKLADSLSQVMTRMVTIQEEIIEALKTAKEAQTVSIEMDGGNFNGKK